MPAVIAPLATASPGKLTAAEIEARVLVLKQHVRSDATDRPGIYKMLSPNGEVLYIGKSKKIRTRLLSYFRCSFPDEKGARIVREAASIEWDYAPSEFAALLSELRHIKRFRPRFNVQMKRDARHYAFIKLGRGRAPRLQVVRGGTYDQGSIYYGPFHGARAVEEAVRELSDLFGLRDCNLDKQMHFSDQAEMFQLSPRTPGCIRLEIAKCLGPCIGSCSERAYMKQVGLARSFLEGSSDGPLDRLRSDMQASSDRLEFERAAAMRDKLQRVEMLRDQFNRLRFAVETLSFLYTVPGVDGDDRVYLIRRGQVRGDVPVPQSRSETRNLREMADDVFSPPERITTAVPTHEIDELLLLSYWFRQNPKELKRTCDAGALKARGARALKGLSRR